MKTLPRGLRNNNPGNIRHDGVTWKGEVKGNDNAFKSFETMAWGYRAMFHLIHNYQRLYKLNTIREIVSRYAPPVENHTDFYIKNVAEWSGVDADTRITTTNRDVMIPIVAAMSRVENGCSAVMQNVEDGWKLFVKNLV